MQFALARKVNGDVMIKSPGFHPNASPDKCKAAVPLQTADEYSAPNLLQSAFSNSEIFGPCVNQSDLRTLTTA